MPWLLAALFVGLLVGVHARDPRLIDRPLSELRDGPHALVGYALFGLLLAAGAGQTRARFRVGGGRQAFVPGLAVGLLLYVALTPSDGPGHIFASLVLLGLVYHHFARALADVSSPWLLAHFAAVPVLVAAVALRPSFGLFQKGLILYLLLTATADWLLVSRRLWLPGPDDFRRKRPRRTVAYRPRVEWRRTDGRPGRQPAGSSV